MDIQTDLRDIQLANVVIITLELTLTIGEVLQRFLAKFEDLWGRDYLTSSLCLSSFSSLNRAIFISLRAAASFPRVRENEEGFAVYRS